MIVDKGARIEWIDVCRGLSILLIVLFHFQNTGKLSGTVSQYAAYFRLPFFFFISGYLHKFKPQPAFIQHKFRCLIVPYLSLIGLNLFFLFSLAGYHFLQGRLDVMGHDVRNVVKVLVGDIRTDTPIAPIWFLTCLFLTQVLFNTFHKRSSLAVVSILSGACLLYLFIDYYWDDPFLPLSLDQIPRALIYYAMGFYLSEFVGVWTVWVSLVYFPAAIFLQSDTVSSLMPVWAACKLGAGIGGIFLMIWLSKVLTRIPPAKSVLIFTGQRAIAILLFHTLLGVMIPFPNAWMKTFLAVLLCSGIYELFVRNRHSARLFLGRAHPGSFTAAGKNA